MPASLPRDWQDVDEKCHYCHWWRDVGCPIITAMNTNDIAILLLLLSVTAAVLGGLGVFGLGKDSRGLDTRQHSGDRPARSLLS